MCLAPPLRPARNRPDFTGQTDLSSEGTTSRQGKVERRTQHRRNNSQIQRGICDAQTSCDVQEHIAGGELESAPLLEHG
jgi:hypothetical protein